MTWKTRRLEQPPIIALLNLTWEVATARGRARQFYPPEVRAAAWEMHDAIQQLYPLDLYALTRLTEILAVLRARMAADPKMRWRTKRDVEFVESFVGDRFKEAVVWELIRRLGLERKAYDVIEEEARRIAAE